MTDKLTTILKGFGREYSIFCEADNIEIHGFTINLGYGGWWAAGIQLDHCNFCLIYDNIILMGKEI